MKRSSPRLGAAALTLVAASATLACGGPAGGGDWNVLLVSIDTLRPDHLGLYGHPLPTSPHLDAFAEDAVVFTEAVAHAPSTLPSHASILTSLVPSRHGASFANRRPLATEHRTLAEVLRDRGYRTAAFQGGGQMDEVWDLDQGFDLYHTVPADRFEATVDEAVAWLDDPAPGREAGEPGRPFFLFLHTYEVHHPYTPSADDLAAVGAAGYDGWLGDSVEVAELRSINRHQAELGPEDARFIQRAYEAEILSKDRAFGRLLKELRARGLYERTLIVFTSDHEEELGEHGQWGWHAHTLFDELLRVPLVVRLPGDGPRGLRLRRQVRSMDIAPTILDVLTLHAPPTFAGVSLRPLWEGEPTDRLLAVSERDVPDDQPPRRSIRTRRWKLYQGRLWRLYDLASDPPEVTNAAPGHWDIVAGLQEALERATGQPPSNMPRIELDEEARERLEALGYL